MPSCRAVSPKRAEKVFVSIVRAFRTGIEARNPLVTLPGQKKSIGGERSAGGSGRDPGACRAQVAIWRHIGMSNCNWDDRNSASLSISNQKQSNSNNLAINLIKDTFEDQPVH